jgi:hypothetical protein
MDQPSPLPSNLIPLARAGSRGFQLLPAILFLALVTGCVTPVSEDRQIALDGTVLYGKVNVAPSEAVTKERFQSSLASRSCELYPDHWCTNQDRYDFVSVLLMNTYQGGARSVGVAIPKAAKVAVSDIVVVKFRKFGGAEFLRIASRGERDGCRWNGGGPFGTLTSGGVVCEGYSWRDVAPKFYY